MTLVSRDPFARTELHRRQVSPSKGETCAECGRLGQRFGRKPFLYEYRTESDGGRAYPHPKRFCSTPCFRAYHER